MSERSANIETFLSEAGWSRAKRQHLAGDASRRRYTRLYDPDRDRHSILMDAPPSEGEDTRPFIAVAGYLQGLGLSAPEILAADSGHGLLLIEDLGDALFARHLEVRADDETRLYRAATDVLLHLHRAPAMTGLSTYGGQTMADLGALAVEWYAGADREAQTDFAGTLAQVLAQAASETPVVALRDYHAENLLWLPDRPGLAAVGLLDFQDAALAHPAYDLVSLLQDARRDVSPDVEAAMKQHYCQNADIDKDAFDLAYATLGLQRNLRIIGVFARLAIRDGKKHYPAMIPRVWSHVLRDLNHPALAAMKSMVHAILPDPEPAVIKQLQAA